MEDDQKRTLIDACLAYLRSGRLPLPLPENAEKYNSWSAQAATLPEPPEYAEEAWLDLDRMITEQPSDAWEVIRTIAQQCRSNDECAALAAGPLTTFLRRYRVAFAADIEEELLNNHGFRIAYNWLQ